MPAEDLDRLGLFFSLLGFPEDLSFSNEMQEMMKLDDCRSQSRNSPSSRQFRLLGWLAEELGDLLSTETLPSETRLAWVCLSSFEKRSAQPIPNHQANRFERAS